MRITKINLYQVSLPMKEGAYSWSNQSFEAFDSTVVHIETDEGLYGVGEICPLGPAYLPAFHEYATHPIATGGPVIKDGVMAMSDKAGLGVEPDWDILGAPIASFSA